MLFRSVEINFEDITESFPAFMTILMMPLAYSIAEGIAFGMISFVLIKVLTGKYKEVSWVMYVLAIIFLIRYMI